MTSNTYIGTLDTRNSQYQGTIKESHPHGLGFLFSLAHQLTLTSWTDTTPNGPLLHLMPDRSYLYGKVKNKKLDGICTYRKSSNEIYYFNFINGISERIAFA